LIAQDLLEIIQSDKLNRRPDTVPIEQTVINGTKNGINKKNKKKNKAGSKNKAMSRSLVCDVANGALRQRGFILRAWAIFMLDLLPLFITEVNYHKSHKVHDE
jgi:hypothetical protein